MTLNPVLAILLIGAPAWAQEAQPVFKSSTRLVQVGVVVQDKNGRPVTRLTAEDFRLKDGGKRRQIRLFTANQSTPRATAPQNSVERAFTNTGAEQEGPGSVTVIVIDYLNTPWSDQAFATRELMKYLYAVKPEDRLAIYSLGYSGLQLLHDYTADASSLIAILAKSKGEIVDPGKTPANFDPGLELARILTGSQQSEGRTHNAAGINGEMASQPLLTLAAFEQLAHILDGIPVRKNVIWISGGFGSQEWGNAGTTAITGHAPAIMQAPAWAGHDNGVRLTDSMDGTQSYSRGIDHAMRQFNEANVAVYPISARGLKTRIPDPQQSSKIVDTAIDAGEQNMISIAAATGGKAFTGNNNIHEAIRTALSASEVTYTLGFYADSGTAHDGFHKIEVTLVNHRGVSLRYRKGYEDNPDPASDGASRETSLDQAGWSPLDSNSIPLTATLEEATGLTLQIGIGSLDLRREQNRRAGSLDVLLVQRDEQGNEYQRVNDTIVMDLKPATFQQFLKTGIPYRHAVPANPNASYVRVVVRDIGTGNIGSLTIPLQRTDYRKDRLGASGN